jgi:DNA-binding transcriptional LysR family regulator
MERNLGVRLFIRTRRSTQLTAVGEALLADARRILADVDATRRNLLSVASGHRGRLRIGLADDLAHPRISKLIADTRGYEPRLDIDVTRAALAAQLAELRSARMDLGFVLDTIDVTSLFHGALAERQWPWAGDDIHVVPLWKDALVAVARRDSLLAARTAVTRAELSAAPIILMGDPASTCKPGEPLIPMNRHPQVECVANVDLLLTLPGAGRGTGSITGAKAETIQWTDLTVRP